MSRTAAVARAPSARTQPSSSASEPLLVQRKCACGSDKKAISERCHECHGNPLQPKVVIGRSDDPLECEADRVADRVMRTPGPSLRLQGGEEDEREGGTLSMLQRSSIGNGYDEQAPSIVHEVLRSPGEPLDPSTREFMESRFGHTFSQVRVHADAISARCSLAVAARAFTAGQDIVFGAGQYAPHNPEGERLLAHELVHTVQQGGTPRRRTSRRGSSWVTLPWRQRFAHPHTSVAGGAGSLDVGTTRNIGTSGRWGVPAIRRAGPIPALQRQATEPETTPQKVWYMLNVPPAIQQPGLTCWAASLASWLSAMRLDSRTVMDVIFRYAGSGCIHPDNSLYYRTAEEVYAEWGVHFTHFAEQGSVTYDDLRALLETHGHLILAETGGAIGHARVVYGVGIDDRRMPNRNYMSVMDPIDGQHRNVSIDKLTYPLEIGFLGSRDRPAACLGTPGEVPEE